MARNPLRTDPTRTITLRLAFAKAIRRRLIHVANAATGVVGVLDAFGLAPRPALVLHADVGDLGAVSGGWRFLSDSAKVAAFVDWLKKQIEDKILEPVNALGDLATEPWLAEFIRPAYRRGVIRAYMDALPVAAAKHRAFYEGGKAQFLHDAFNSPVAVDKLKLIFTRDFEKLKGITGDMSAKMSGILADGIAKGSHPYDVARAMSAAVDGISRKRAEVLARTEIIHAHAEGQLDAMERLGLDEVTIMAEWTTAGDDRVCPLCAEREGEIIPIKEAHGLIPLHPQCRCSWLPVAVTALRRENNRRAPTPLDVATAAE